MSDKFYSGLAARESSNNPRAVNTLGFMGLYQMGKPALQDAGYMNADGTWTNKNGIGSQEDFLNNPAVQTAAIKEYHAIVWNRYLSKKVKESVGNVVGGITVTKNGLIAGAHLVGHRRVAEFIESDGRTDPQDSYGTKCSEYLKKFA